jgi:hypothetical protein
MEEQLFPLEALEPAYDQAVWLYVYRDFSEDERDRADERICLRFGFTSYPQHKLVHPETLEIIGDSGRSVESLLGAFERAKVKVGKTTDAAGLLTAAEERAKKLEASPTAKAAEGALEDEDLVVRLRAIQILSEERPGAIVRRAEGLLAVENDPLRYAVCEALAKEGDPSAARALDALVVAPKGSLNPNVLRSHAVQALARCGDTESVDVLAPHADGSQFRNYLTRRVVTTLAAIAEREKGERDRVRDLLVGTFPEPQDDERMQRIALGLAQHVHTTLKTLTGRKVDFPGDYDERGLAKLRRDWSRVR